jgi:pilus assembly protein CpaB
LSAAARLPARGLQAVLIGAVVGVSLIVYGGHRLAAPPPSLASEPRPAPQPVLAPAVAAPPASLAVKVPEGLRAFAIQTTEEIAVGHLLQPGDRVDVQTVLGQTVLGGQAGKGPLGEAGTLMQNVLVLAVGDRLEPGAAGKSEEGQARTLTLALTPEQVSQLSLARSLGTFYLALRNPGDQGAPTPAAAHLSDLRHVVPAPRRQARRAAPARETGVELTVAGVSSVLRPAAGAAK